MTADFSIAPCDDPAQASDICDTILAALPDWFGPRDIYGDYLDDVQRLPTRVAWQDESPVAILTLAQTAAAAVDIHLMAVCPDRQGEGLGRALVDCAKREAQELGAWFLTVKTLGPSHPSPAYARTRGFYAHVGFVTLEEFPDFWGEGYPMQLMCQTLDRGRLPVAAT